MRTHLFLAAAVVASGCVSESPDGLSASSAGAQAACVHKARWWAEHPEQWPVQTLAVGGAVYGKAELLFLLEARPHGDVSLILGRQVIAARLNEANGGIPGEAAAAALPLADAWLIQNRDSDGRLPYGTRCNRGQRAADPDEDPEDDEEDGLADASFRESVCREAVKLARKIKKFNKGKAGATCEASTPTPTPTATSTASPSPSPSATPSPSPSPTPTLPPPPPIKSGARILPFDCCTDPTCDRDAHRAIGGVCPGDPRIRGPQPPSGDSAASE